MKKITKLSKLKKDFEKVYENPLNWCPLYGYLPEIKKSDFVNNPENYSIALRCSELIQETRYDFFEADYMQVYISLPDVEQFPYPHKNYKEKSLNMRLLFQNLDSLSLKMRADVRGCEGMPDKPVGRISNRYTHNIGSIFAGGLKLNDSVVTIDYLLMEAQKITGKELDYYCDAKHFYALHMILESWLILTSLFFNPDRTKSKDVLDDINDRIIYIFDLRETAQRYRYMWEIEPDLKEKEKIKKIAAPYIKSQRDRANKKNKLTKEKNEPRDKHLILQSREYLKVHGKTSAQTLYNHFLKNDAKKKMKEKNIQFDIKLRQFTSIIEPVLNEYKEKNK